MDNQMFTRPVIQISHILTTVSMLLAGTVYVMAADSDQRSNTTEVRTRQEMIIKEQKEMKEDLKQYQSEQRAIQRQQMELLNQIKGRLDQ